eukprot:COSAG04_NODE_924_length_9380_cov_8.463312_6_plen_934_part_00
MFVTTEQIAKGSEITIDYSNGFWRVNSLSVLFCSDQTCCDLYLAQDYHDIRQRSQAQVEPPRDQMAAEHDASHTARFAPPDFPGTVLLADSVHARGYPPLERFPVDAVVVYCCDHNALKKERDATVQKQALDGLLCKLFAGEPWMTQSGKWRARPKSDGLKGQQRRSGQEIVRDWTDSRGGWTVVLCEKQAGREVAVAAAVVQLNDGHPLIRCMVTHPQHRKRGLARRLIEHIHHQAWRRKLHKVFAEFDSTVTQQTLIWRKLGFADADGSARGWSSQLVLGNGIVGSDTLQVGFDVPGRRCLFAAVETSTSRNATHKRTDSRRRNEFPKDARVEVLYDRAQDHGLEDGVWYKGWIDGYSPKGEAVIHFDNGEVDTIVPTNGGAWKRPGAVVRAGGIRSLEESDVDDVVESAVHALLLDPLAREHSGSNLPAVFTDIGLVKTGDRLNIRSLGDDKVYRAEVCQVSHSHGVTVKYPGRNGWQGYTDIHPISTIVADRVSFGALSDGIVPNNAELLAMEKTRKTEKKRAPPPTAETNCKICHIGRGRCRHWNRAGHLQHGSVPNNRPSDAIAILSDNTEQQALKRVPAPTTVSCASEEAIMVASAATVARRVAAGEQSSPYAGVSWDKKARRWRAEIAEKGRRCRLGSHLKEEDAARAFDVAARRVRGQQAHGGRPRSGGCRWRLNFPTPAEIAGAEEAAADEPILREVREVTKRLVQTVVSENPQVRQLPDQISPRQSGTKAAFATSRRPQTPDGEPLDVEMMMLTTACDVQRSPKRVRASDVQLGRQSSGSMGSAAGDTVTAAPAPAPNIPAMLEIAAGRYDLCGAPLVKRPRLATETTTLAMESRSDEAELDEAAARAKAAEEAAQWRRFSCCGKTRCWCQGAPRTRIPPRRSPGRRTTGAQQEFQFAEKSYLVPRYLGSSAKARYRSIFLT